MKSISCGTPRYPDLDYTCNMFGKHLRVGEAGEKATVNHLKRNGFQILERNYRKKWGEIDIIARRDGVLHFVEVKTVSYFPRSSDTWRPEENVDSRKLRKLLRTAETWVLENRYEGAWQVDVAAVRLDPDAKSGTIKVIDNVILE